MTEYNKFDSEFPTIEIYCRRHDFSSIEKLSTRCNLTNKIKEQYKINLEEDCIYRDRNHCMNIDKR